MGITFTPEQKQVIELHDCNILVSAAAGSGKTAVLSERIVQMVCRKENPVDIDRLLIVTFTNAAAAEMRERISQAIMERLNEDGDNEHLQKQAALLHNAQITTIDSFCLFVLRNNFQDIGLDPAFRVADEGELELLRQEVLAALLEERFAAGEESFYHCVEYFCPGGRESVLEEHILKLCEYALSFPFPEEWLNERKADYRIADVEALEQSEWGQYLLVHVQRLIESYCQDMQEAVSICEQPDGPYMYGELLEQEKEMLEGLCKLTSLSVLTEKLPAVTFGRLPSKKDESVSVLKRERAKELREGVKEGIKKLNTSYFAMPLETAIRQAGDCEAAICVLIDLCLEFKARLDEKKREKKLLDFSDMEHFALQILVEKTEDGKIVPTKTAKEYQEYFAEVLIDEYQDSNLVQELLLKSVSGEDTESYNRFMVGDVKQSIYKFRLARPDLFLEKYHTYSQKEGGKRRIDLHKNFRSRKEVVDTVNTVFSRIMTKGLGGIEYDEAAALYPGAVYPENTGCESELILFEKPEKDAEWNARQAEAMGIAARIKELMQNFKVTDKQTGQLRPVMYRDMVVLLRTNSGWDEEFKSVFAKEGIPAYVAGKTGYFATKEIQDILQFLRVLDNPLQDIPLFGVMKSVFGGFTDEEAAQVRGAGVDRGSSLYECLKVCAGVAGGTVGAMTGAADGTKRHDKEALDAARGGSGTPENVNKDVPVQLYEKCRTFLACVAEYRSYTAYMPILELLKKLLEDFDYMAYVAALPAGSQRLANVEMLLTKAAAFEKNSYYGLFHFVRYVEQLEKYNVDYGEASTLDENADVVRIMSIHKSKGLEFPVAFVAGLSKRFNMQDTTQALIVDVDMGLGVDYVNPDARVKNKTLRKNVLATKMKLENLAEELRVLYVAMTRAREKLIMTGVTEKPEEVLEKLEDVRMQCVPAQGAQAADGAVTEQNSVPPIRYTRLTGAGSFLDYLLPVFPNIIVKTEAEMAMYGLLEEVSEAGRRIELEHAAEFADEEALMLLKERFAYVYPHKNLEKLYTKTTVSELKMAAMESKEEEPAHALFPQEEIHPYIPAFMREKEAISGTTRGSAVHRVMELLDFCGEYRDIDTVTSAMEGFMQEGRLTEEYKNAVNPKKILCFLQSSLAKRMQAAARSGRLYREQPFVYGISADRLPTETEGSGKFPGEETVLIQGIVDAFFEEGDGLVLLDYKTDVIDKPEELVKRYKAQLDYYEEALVALTGKKVKERVLYSFYLGCEVPILS